LQLNPNTGVSRFVLPSGGIFYPSGHGKQAAKKQPRNAGSKKGGGRLLIL